RLLDPVVQPRRALALIIGGNPDGRMSAERLLHDLRIEDQPQRLANAIIPAARPVPAAHPPLVVFDRRQQPDRLSVREALRGKQILLIGVTGFIGKVWLEHLLSDLPEIGKIYLLIRRQRTASALRRFEKIVEESPVFDRLEQHYGNGMATFLANKIEVVTGDVSQPGLGLEPELRA